MISKLFVISLTVLMFFSMPKPVYSSDGGAAPYLLLGTLLVIPPITGAAISEKFSDRDEDNYIKNIATNILLSGYSAIIIAHKIENFENLSNHTPLIGYGSWIISTIVYSFLFNQPDVNIEPLLLIGTYGTNSLGIALEIGYKDFYLIWSYGSFGDQSVGASDEVFTEDVDVVSLKYLLLQKGRHSLYPEIYYKSAELFYSKDYQEAARAKVNFGAIGLQYEYSLLDLFPIHANLANEFALPGAEKFYETANRSPLINISVGLSIGYSIVVD